MTDSAPRRPKVLAVSLVFPPDGVSTAQLFGEIVEDLRDSGFDVSVVTTVPHYNEDPDAAAVQPIRMRRFGLIGRSSFRGIDVRHVRMPQKAPGAAGRFLQWIWFATAAFCLAVGSQRRGIDAIVTVSPPPSVAAACAVLRKVFRIPYLYNVWELYPDIAVKLGALAQDGLPYRAMKRLERFTYTNAAHVTVLHDAMRDAVLTSGSDPATTHVVPTFADVEFLRPLTRDTTLRSELGLGDGFVVGYAGNLGTSQDLNGLLKAASKLGSRAGDIDVVLCGDGVERDRLDAEAKRLKLERVHLTGHLPYARVPEIYATFDLSVVVLTDGVAAEALPSKVYRMMACGCPILALTTPDSPLARLVETHEIGFVLHPADVDGIAALIQRLAADPVALEQCALRSRNVAVERFSRSTAKSTYKALVSDMIEK